MQKLDYYASYCGVVLLQGVTKALENTLLTRIFVCKCYRRWLHAFSYACTDCWDAELAVLPELPSTLWLLVLVLVALLALVLRVFPLGMYLLGLCWACISAQAALDDQLQQGLDGRTLWLEGAVVGLPGGRRCKGSPPLCALS